MSCDPWLSRQKMVQFVSMQVTEKQHLPAELTPKFIVNFSPSHGFSAGFESERCMWSGYITTERHKFGDILSNLSQSL